MFQLYAIAVKDLIRKSDRNYKVTSRNSTVEYTLSRLEPGGKYHVIVQLGNMSEDASVKVTTGEQGRAACAGSCAAGSSKGLTDTAHRVRAGQQCEASPAGRCELGSGRPFHIHFLSL